MLGFLMLKQTYLLGVLLAPLPVGTVWFWYWTTKTYKRTAKFVPLVLLSPKQLHHLSDNNGSLAPRGSEAASSQGLGHVIVKVDMDSKKSVANGLSGNRTSIEAAAAALAGPSGSKRKQAKKAVVDEHDYQVTPDRHTDYRQPPMTLYPGVLNSGMRHYCHPAIAGALPTLWLPLREDKIADDDDRRSDDEDESDPTRDSDLPRNYDEWDNLVGGGQDEDESENATSLTEEPQARGEDDVPSNVNPAVEGISEVYYHHPE
ncbi:hypothetical protein BGZ65_012049, partial [Modicella reniformis]